MAHDLGVGITMSAITAQQPDLLRLAHVRLKLESVPCRLISRVDVGLWPFMCSRGLVVGRRHDLNTFITEDGVEVALLNVPTWLTLDYFPHLKLQMLPGLTVDDLVDINRISQELNPTMWMASGTNIGTFTGTFP